MTFFFAPHKMKKTKGNTPKAPDRFFFSFFCFPDVCLVFEIQKKISRQRKKIRGYVFGNL